MDIRYNWEILTHDFTNLSIVHRRHVDGQLFSMHQSGTHWLKNMLVSVICTEYDIPVPDKISDTTVIGSSKNHTQYEHIPNIFASHNIPSPLVATWLVSAFVKLPPRILLIRDIRSFTVSHYEKCKNEYEMPFSEYLRGDPSSERFDYDVWLTIRFLNAWGRILKHYPDSTHPVRYENLMENPVSELEKCCTHFGIRFKGTPAIEDAVRACSKDAMEKRQSKLTGQVVRRDSRSVSDWYNEKDRQFFSQLCSRHLKYNFGYDYNVWN